MVGFGGAGVGRAGFGGANVGRAGLGGADVGRATAKRGRDIVAVLDERRQAWMDLCLTQIVHPGFVYLKFVDRAQLVTRAVIDGGVPLTRQSSHCFVAGRQEIVSHSLIVL